MMIRSAEGAVNMTIKWNETEIAIKDLKEYGRNPRSITKDQFNHLVKSLKQDGYHQRLIVNTDGTIIGGHQRKKAFLLAGFKEDHKIPVLMPDRFLQVDEFKRLNVRDNLPFGEFDFDILASDFDVNELIEWGMPEEWLPSYEEPEEKSEKDVASGDNQTECPKCGHRF